MTHNLGSFTLEAYEWTGKKISGFKVFKNYEQVGTIEKRGKHWIGAALNGLKIETFEYKEFESAFDELIKKIA